MGTFRTICLGLLAAALSLGCGKHHSTDPGDSGTEEDGGQSGPPEELSGPAGGGDWVQYRADGHGTWVNRGTFTAAQAAGVTPLWSATAGPAGYAQPIIVGDSVYVATASVGKVISLDAQTGAERWTRALDGTLSDPCSVNVNHPGFWAAPAFANNTLFAASPDGNLYALDPTTGATLRQSPVATPSSPPELMIASPMPSVELGKLYTGVSAVFNCAHVPGRVISVDLATGTSQTVHLTSGNKVGASVWSSLAVDPSNRRIYATTSDPVNQPLAELPLSQAFVAMDADTLAVTDHWQNPAPPPNANSDFGASPTLFTDSEGTPMIAAANKDGKLYALKRDKLSDGPVWTYAIAVGGPDPLAADGSLVAPTFTHKTLFAAGGKTTDGKPGVVVALDPKTGTEKWKHVTPGYVFAGMPALGDILIVVSNALDGTKSYLELLNVATGESIKTFEAAGRTFAAPAVGRSRIVWYSYAGVVQALAIPPTP